MSRRGKTHGSYRSVTGSSNETKHRQRVCVVLGSFRLCRRSNGSVVREFSLKDSLTYLPDNSRDRDLKLTGPKIKESSNTPRDVFVKWRDLKE